jgi:broad specificity phosphatase PhoE
MRRSLRRTVPPLVFLLLAFVAVAASRQPAETTTTIILVRHAEKAAVPADDPPLTAEGETRALALVEVVRSAGVSAIYSTRWKRTQGTAAPVATQLGIPVTTFDGPATAYAAELLGKHRGKVVLVVGHSNTLPGIIRALGIPSVPPIEDPEYSNLFIVSVPDAGAARYIRAEFGG